MRINPKMSSQTLGIEPFELLRARLESELKRPVVIAITSLTNSDGRDVTARGLARSFAAAGYSTLLIETATAAATGSTGTEAGLEVGRLKVFSRSAADHLDVVSFSDSTLQSTTSQRDIAMTFETLRSRFEYVVVSADLEKSASFGASILAASDAVLVSVRSGRPQNAGDGRLAAELDRMGSRFLGVIALSSEVINSPASFQTGRNSINLPGVATTSRREVAESAS